MCLCFVSYFLQEGAFVFLQYLRLSGERNIGYNTLCVSEGVGGVSYNSISHCQVRMQSCVRIRARQMWGWRQALLYTNTVLQLLEPHLLHLQNGDQNCSLNIAS